MTTKLPTTDKSIDSTKQEEFKPTPHMLVWIDTAMKSGSDVIDEISNLSGVDESTYYGWIKKPEFVEWFNGEWERRLRSQAWKLDQYGMKNAKRDFNYWKAMQNRVGRLEDKPSALQQFNIGNDMGIEFVGEEGK